MCVVSSARGPCNLLLIFWHHQLVPSVGNSLATCKPYYRFLDKELHSTHSLNGNHQQHLGRRAATHCFGEAIPNPYSSSGTSHQTESRPKREVTPEERRSRHSARGAEQRDQEGLEGSNAPSRPKQQDINRPSVTDTTPPYIIAEMQMMKERMDLMMNALKGRVSSDLDDLVH